MKIKKIVAAAVFATLALFGAACAFAEGKKSAANKTASAGQKPSAQISIQAPKEKIKYQMVDSHLHYLDFLQKLTALSRLSRRWTCRAFRARSYLECRWQSSGTR